MAMDSIFEMQMFRGEEDSIRCLAWAKYSSAIVWVAQPVSSETRLFDQHIDVCSPARFDCQTPPSNRELGHLLSREIQCVSAVIDRIF